MFASTLFGVERCPLSPDVFILVLYKVISKPVYSMECWLILITSSQQILRFVCIIPGIVIVLTVVDYDKDDDDNNGGASYLMQQYLLMSELLRTLPMDMIWL